MVGKVIRGVGGCYIVLSDSQQYKCTIRGKIKLTDRIVVGDEVVIVKHSGGYYIEEILPRRNSLVRPYVSNVDTLIIVIASSPQVDYELVDKLLVFCNEFKITPILCYNKIDVTREDEAYINKVYGTLCKVISVSAVTGEGLPLLREELKKGVSCFAGQSAVGKSSIINAIAGLEQETGSLSRIMRGRNTTRNVEIFRLSDELLIADTCGFSLLELQGIESSALSLYYADFLSVGRCRYNMCSHIDEPDCAVRHAVETGDIDIGRYQRYLNIYSQIKEKEDSQYE